MKKIYILIFTFLMIFIGNNKAQSGIDIALVPIDFNRRADLDDNGRNTFYNGVHYGFKIGYFDWTTASQMKFISLQVSTINKDFSYINNVTNSIDEKENYTHSATSFLFRIGTMRVFNEIDFKSHIYFKNAFLFALRNDAVSFISKERYYGNGNEEKYFSPTYKDPLQFSFGYDIGFGYQYNLTPKLGLYADANVGFRFFEMMSFINTNIGARYRFK
jgi:hypothetical protein